MDRILTDNINKNKYQHNDDIDNEPTFDNKIFNLSSGNKDPLLVVIVILRVVKKHISTTVAVLTCLWGSGANYSMIKIRHNKCYELKIRSNKVEYSTAVGLYFTTHDVKVPFAFHISLSAR